MNYSLGNIVCLGKSEDGSDEIGYIALTSDEECQNTHTDDDRYLIKLFSDEVGYYGSDYPAPVKLTKEILTKLGFELKDFENEFDGKTQGYCTNHYMFIKGVWHLGISRHGVFVSFIAYGNFLRKLEYVHELQNLYYTLTGDNLVFNP